MAPSFSFEVQGLKELEDALLNLAPKQVRAVMRPALAESGSWMASKISAAAPVAPTDRPHPEGELRNTVKTEVRISQRQDEATCAVGYSDDQFYAWFVEFGHRQVRGGYSRLDKYGRNRGPGHVIGDMVPPHPFVRTTFDANAEQWTELLADSVRAGLGWE